MNKSLFILCPLFTCLAPGIGISAEPCDYVVTKDYLQQVSFTSDTPKTLCFPSALGKHFTGAYRGWNIQMEMPAEPIVVAQEEMGEAPAVEEVSTVAESQAVATAEQASPTVQDKTTEENTASMTEQDPAPAPETAKEAPPEPAQEIAEETATPASHAVEAPPALAMEPGQKANHEETAAPETETDSHQDGIEKEEEEAVTATSSKDNDALKPGDIHNEWVEIGSVGEPGTEHDQVDQKTAAEHTPAKAHEEQTTHPEPMAAEEHAEQGVEKVVETVEVVETAEPVAEQEPAKAEEHTVVEVQPASEKITEQAPVTPEENTVTVEVVEVATKQEAQKQETPTPEEPAAPQEAEAATQTAPTYAARLTVAPVSSNSRNTILVANVEGVKVPIIIQLNNEQ